MIGVEWTGEVNVGVLVWLTFVLAACAVLKWKGGQP